MASQEGVLAAGPSFTIKIVLPEDLNGQPDDGEVRKGGDVLAGYLEVLIDSIVGLNIMVVLEESQYVKTTSIHRHQSKEGQISYQLPFAFVIPHKLISPKSDVASEYLNLLPSMKEGLAFKGPLTGRIYMQPNVTYTITATPLRIPARVGSAMRWKDRREISIMPSIPAAPPLQIDHFPCEYRTNCGKTLKQHFWSRPAGRVIVSAEEPEPLNISTSAPRATSTVSVKLSFEPCATHTPPVRPYEWNVTVKYYLRIRTFYTTRQYTQVPTKKTAKTEALVQKSSSTTMPEVRQCNTLSWRLQRLSSAGTITEDTEVLPWTTTLTVPVNASKTLVPTFLCPLSTRRYALVMEVSIANVNHDVMALEIPIQVISETTLPEKPSLNGAVGGSIDHELLEGLLAMNPGNGNMPSLEEAIQPPSYDEV
ncbi:MAG: hypothetical protein M1827_004948 [Pycnora praestabilis]|nr:MAG: hypothetical protein M1827_004948 [Pycnora praestabilis]